MTHGGEFKIRKVDMKKMKIQKAPTSPIEDILKSNTIKKLKTSEMVNQALKETTSNPRKGTSLQAIKKYIAMKYEMDLEKSGYLIKKYIKLAVEKGIIIQTSGIGASGSFRLDSKKKNTSDTKIKKKSIKKSAPKETKINKENTEPPIKVVEEKKKISKPLSKEVNEKKKLEKPKKTAKSVKVVEKIEKIVKTPKQNKIMKAKRKSFAKKTPIMKPKTPMKPKAKKPKKGK